MHNIDLQQLKLQVELFLSEGKIEKSIEELSAYAQQENNTELSNNLVQQNQRLNKIKNDSIAGTISSDEAQIGNSKITQNLLILLQDLGSVNTKEGIQPGIEETPLPQASESDKSGKFNLYHLLIVAFLAIVSFGGYMFYQHLQEQKFQELLKTANTAFEAEHYLDAAIYYESLLAKQPENAICLERFGYCLYDNGKYYESIKVFDSAIDITAGREVQLFFFRANAKFKNGNFLDAIEDYNTFLDFKPNHSSGINHRGLCYVKSKDWEKGCDDFLEAANLGNPSAEININKYCLTDNSTQ